VYRADQSVGDCLVFLSVDHLNAFLGEKCPELKSNSVKESSMTQHSILILNDPAVCTALKQAWQESNPGVSGGHEEGGFLWQQH
jgi:hypothetical protein